MTLKFSKFIHYLLILSLTGCASTYHGPMSPNFNLRNKAEKEKEIASFALEESSFWTTSTHPRFKGKSEFYTLDSMRPLIYSVSPEAADRISNVHTWLLAQNIFYAVALLSAFGRLLPPQHRGWTWPTFFSSLGLAYVCTFGAVFTAQGIYHDYNVALGSRLAQRETPPPLLVLSFSY